MTERNPLSAIGPLMLLMLVLAMLGQLGSEQPARHTETTSFQPASEDIEVYSLYDLSHPLTSLAWGTLTPGESAHQDVYVGNNNHSATYNLSMSTSNWDPPQASTYMGFSWNCTGQTVNPQSSVCARFALEVYPDCTGVDHFSFTINLNYEEVI